LFKLSAFLLTAHLMLRILFELADFFIWETLPLPFLYFRKFPP
jgi:hypothetical protein